MILMMIILKMSQERVFKGDHNFLSNVFNFLFSLQRETDDETEDSGDDEYDLDDSMIDDSPSVNETDSGKIIFFSINFLKFKYRDGRRTK